MFIESMAKARADCLSKEGSEPREWIIRPGLRELIAREFNNHLRVPTREGGYDTIYGIPIRWVTGATVRVSLRTRFGDTKVVIA